jgi:hypothetical protein
MQVFAKNINGKTVSVEAEPSETINSVKVKIANAFGSPQQPDFPRQRLVLARGQSGPTQLDDGRTIADYGIDSGSSIYFIAPF